MSAHSSGSGDFTAEFDQV